MRKTFLAAIAASVAVLAIVPAFAGDIASPAVPVTKASVAPSTWLNGYPYGSSGVIVGLYTEAGGGPVTANVAGVNPASLTTTTAGIGIMAGYAWGSKNSQFAYSLEGKVSANNFNGENQGFSVAGPVSAEGTGYIWMPVSLIQSTFSLLNLSNPLGTIAPFPLNPSGVTASNVQAGFGAGFRADDVTVAFLGAGSNKVWNFAPKIEADLMEQLSNGSAVREYVEVVFESKGATFGAAGAPPVSAKQDTKYLAGVMVGF